ncbi:MAG: putative motility protein [Gammaproteobacteria bacterium]|nr:putative motility protein [Gammaproteobacteria bacterium]
MGISGVSAGGMVSAALAQKEVYTQAEVQTGMLKKSIDMGAENALMLIESIPALTASSSLSTGLPSHLGSVINTKA